VSAKGVALVESDEGALAEGCAPEDDGKVVPLDLGD